MPLPNDALDTLAKLQAVIAADGVEDVPEGWYTIEEWAKAWNKSRNQAGAILRRAKAAGVFEMRVFRLQAGRFKHYREVGG